MKMKKYLMTGIAALAMCVGFTSCSHDLEPLSQEEINELEAQKITANYNKAFMAYIGGKVESTQTWGFGPAAGARTRGEGDEHFYADANEWAAKDGEKYLVPDPLTAGQKARVQYYYQMNQKNAENEDKGQIDFFVQQVYKGGTDPMGSPYSAEQYIDANNEKYIVGSDHMDQLTAGSNSIHINDFNYGNYNHGATYPNVLDNDPVVINNYPNATNGGYVKNENTAHHHGDQISLMLDTKTDTFGYENSNSSVQRNLYWMRSAAQIDAYIDANKSAYEAWLSTKKDANGNAIEDAIVNDFWGQLGRGFIGFDFEMMVGPELFQENRFVELSDIPGNAPQYIWDGKNVIKWFDPIVENYQTVGYNFAEGYDKYIKINREKIPYLSTNKNLYAGERLEYSETLTNITQTNLKVYKDYSEDVKNVECLNLPLLRDAFQAGYYPTEDKAQTWIRVGNTADGYYSDWIVTFMPALHYTNTTDIIDDPTPTPDTWSVRVMAEDLSATENSDFDFNDVVIDVTYTKGESTASITLQAAGGTLPLRINQNDNWEVHKLFNVPVNYMVNTNWGGSNSASCEPVPLTPISFSATTEEEFLAGVKNIKLEVEKTNSSGTKQWIEMKAEQGEPASKFAIPLTDPSVKNWCDEQVSIKRQYTKFADWARTGLLDFKWW